MIIQTRYEVIETDADFDEIRLIHSGYSKDIAETKMVKQFRDAAYMRDYMLINRNTQEIISACLTPETAVKRNECQR